MEPIINITITLDCSRCDWGLTTMDGAEAAIEGMAHELAHAVAEQMDKNEQRAAEIKALNEMLEQS